MRRLVIGVAGLLLTTSAMAEDKDKPAAQGYIKGQESNKAQGAALKKLEAEEAAQNQPPPKPSPSPSPSTNKGAVAPK